MISSEGITAADFAAAENDVASAAADQRPRRLSDAGMMMELRGVTKHFGNGSIAVAGVDLDVREGEFVSLLGPSGSGKTTTLRMIAGFERPDSGTILVEGQAVDRLPAYRRPINTVFQDYALFPHLDVRANVAFGLRAAKVKRPEMNRRVQEALEMVSVLNLADRRPAQLSGGQRQRVALARALVMKPKILLLDEPLGALDMKLRTQMQFVLVDLCHDLGISFLYVTHDQSEAFRMSDRVAVMSEGRVEQFSDPRSLYEQPATAFVAGFVGEMNFLEGTLAARPDATGETTAKLGESVILTATASDIGATPVGGTVRVAVRPEHVSVLDYGSTGAIGGRIARAVFISGVVRTHIELETGHIVQADLTGAQATRYPVGARLGVVISEAHTRVFGA